MTDFDVQSLLLGCFKSYWQLLNNLMELDRSFKSVWRVEKKRSGAIVYVLVEAVLTQGRARGRLGHRATFSLRTRASVN